MIETKGKYGMNKFNDAHNPTQIGAQFGIVKNTIREFSLNIKEHILATHQELAELRQCSELLRNKPNRKVHIIAPSHRKQSNFIKTTLIHFGVSCGHPNR